MAFLHSAGNAALNPDRFATRWISTSEYTRDSMNTSRLAGLALLGMFSTAALSHGLVQDPPSRNWFCGAITKPDHVANGTAQYPVCGQAFNDPDVTTNDGYSFMSVLTHTTGRAGV